VAGGPGGRQLTHYEVLGVRPDASAAELRRAYVALARRHHPDAPGGDERRMQSVTAAWAVLGDPARRAAYDVSLGGGPAAGPAARPFRPFDRSVDPDPLDQPDVPYRPAPTVNRSLPLLPVGLFAASVAVFSVGLVLGAAPVLGLGIVLFVAASIGMFVVPLLALSRARDDEG
jgi:hypothetical protein